MTLQDHLNKKNLHHAYLIEGARENILAQVLEFTEGEIIQFSFDTLKIDDARAIKSNALLKSASENKRFFIISVNSILLEAQNTLLKIFEEPIQNTHFFVITPDASGLLKTLISRFYFISLNSSVKTELRDAEKFITMTQKARLDFIKELLNVEELEEEDIIELDSVRARSLRFLNALESILHEKIKKEIPLNSDFFHHFFKIREFLRAPGSSPKTLMESVALIIPSLSK